LGKWQYPVTGTSFQFTTDVPFLVIQIALAAAPVSLNNLLALEDMHQALAVDSVPPLRSRKRIVDLYLLHLIMIFSYFERRNPIHAKQPPAAVPVAVFFHANICPKHFSSIRRRSSAFKH
jgi:hypothetical protein